MFGRAIWDELSKYVFEIFELARVKWGQFQTFQKSPEWFILKSPEPNMLLLVNYTKPTNTFYWLYVLIMSHTRLRVNPHSTVAWMSRNSMLEVICIKCGFTLKRVLDMIRTYSQLHRTDKYSEHSSIIWSVWANGWVFVYELSGFGFESSCTHLNFLLKLTSLNSG